MRFNQSPRGLLGLLLTAFLIVGTVYVVEAYPLSQSAGEGQAIFQQKCAACHTIGGGPLVGPDLRGVLARRDRDWLVRIILEPDKLLAEGDPLILQLLEEFNDIPMPNMGLSEAEVTAVLAYLEAKERELSPAQPTQTEEPLPAQPTQTEELPSAQPARTGEPSPAQPTQTEEPPPQPTQTPTPALPAGDPLMGKALFTGATRFQNGGSPCIACHNIAGIGALGGGTLGPDLTQAFNKYGEASLLSVLATLPFPSMASIYDNRPLTPEEQVDLKAFLRVASAQQPTRSTGQLGLLALGGFLALMVLAQVVWRRRLRGVRRPLVEQTQVRRIAE